MPFGHFVSGNYIPRAGKCVKTKVAKFRSSYELMFCNLLDDAKIVKSWEYEQVFIKYYYGKKKRTYIVDFDITLQNGKRFLIEIKPATFYVRAMTNHDMNFFKWEAAKAFAAKHDIVFKVLTEVTLPKLANEWRKLNDQF